MLAIDDIVRIKAFFSREATPYERTLNVFHYRVKEPGGSDNLPVDLGDILANFLTVVATPMLANMGTDTCLMQLRCGIIDPTVSFEVVTDYAFDEKPGSLTLVSHATSQSRAACLVRRSFAPGRQGIGRTFFGPLHDIFTDGDLLVVDPTLFGDLNDVQAGFNSFLTPPDGPTLVPNIWGPVSSEGPISKATRDQRVCQWTPLLSTLRTRRLGHGS